MDEEGCVAYSGSDPGDDIEVRALDAESVLLSNGTMSKNLTGVQLKYKNGASCPSSQTDEEYSFTINVYCDPDT